MSNSKKHSKNNKKNRNIIIGVGALIVLVAILFATNGKKPGGSESKDTVDAQQGGDLVITKSEITETAAFVPYDADGTYMEIIAVKASDGSIRTAFNTCQVCYDSGRGYYVQEGNELVCQNCGNRFKISQVEKEKNGCNPIPVLEENKTDDGTTITIPESFIKQNAEYFSRWSKV